MIAGRAEDPGRTFAAAVGRALAVAGTGCRRLCLSLGVAGCLALTVFGGQLSDFLGRRVTGVDVLIEGAPNSNTAEMRRLIDVATDQDYSPARIHDSLVRLYGSGLISGARVEAEAAGQSGVALRFVLRPQARIESLAFEGNTIFQIAELRARLTQLDPGDRLSGGVVARGVGDLLSFYSTRGYYNARVSSDVRLDPTGARAVVAYSITPGEQARVSKYTLQVKGEKIDLSRLPHSIAEGQPFTQAAVQDALDHIKDAYLQKEYLAVRVTSSITPDVSANKAVVTITVEPGPIVQVEVQGLTISEKLQRSTLPFYRQGGVDEFTLEEGRRRLQDYAQRQGFFFAQVTRPGPPDLSGPATRLVYSVDPGLRYRLTNIEIHGVTALSPHAVEDEMKSKTGAILPLFQIGRGITSDELLRQDANLIMRRLRDAGYRRPRVEVRRGVSLSGGNLIITFDVQQGPRTHVEEVAVRGNNVLTTSELSKELTIKPSDPLLASAVNQNADQLLGAYTVRGYATAEVVWEVVELGSFEGKDRVRLVYDVNEGNRVRVASVSTHGAAYADTGRLERNFYRFKPGQWLRTDKLQRTERDLYDTNAFNSVNISSDQVGQSDDGVEERNVTVNVLEAKRYDVIFGFGFQTNNSHLTVPGLSVLHGLRGLVQLTDNDLFGKLYTGSTQVRISENELFGQISFQDPRPFGIRYPTLFSLFGRRLAEVGFGTDRYTASIQTERRISPELIIYLSYNFERIQLFCPCSLPLNEIERNSRPIRLGRMGPSFARDTRDNKFEPTTGSQTLGSFYVAAKALGGTEQFVKLLLEHSRYYPIHRFRDTVYSVSGRLGLAKAYGGNTDLPISEKFFAGGARDLRGFGFEEAGPHILVPERDINGNIIIHSNGLPNLIISPLGGKGVVVINNEVKFPLYRLLGGAVFSDTGNVFANLNDIKPNGLTQTFGFGLRVRTPVGPVRLDFAWLVANRPQDVSGFHVHFTIGQAF